MFILTKKVKSLLSLLVIIPTIYSVVPVSASEELYTIIGANGNTGSVVAKSLLAQGKSVRVVLHKPEQAERWQS